MFYSERKTLLKLEFFDCCKIVTDEYKGIGL